MKVELTALEARVIGCLIEKELITPDQYPLSLNALTAAVNQKTSRDPVMELGEAEVRAVLDGLMKKHLVFEKSGFGSRVLKYQHRLIGTEFSEIKATPQERGILCVMLLRGPQTVAELRARTNRLCEFSGGDEVERVLGTLMSRDSGALVVRLPRSPGEREPRYMHLLCGPVGAAADAEQERHQPLRTHRGGCHCGKVRFEVDAPARITVSDCNCSICAKSGYLHLIVEAPRFRLLAGAEALTTYNFNTGAARHLFCSVCGVKSFYVPRSHPNGYSVNARCLDAGTVESMKVVPFDGRDWESAMAQAPPPAG